MNKKIVVKGGKMKTSPGFATENEMRGKISQVTEDITKKLDSPKEVPYKENEEASSQRLSSVEVQKVIKEKKTKELEQKKKPTPKVLELYAT